MSVGGLVMQFPLLLIGLNFLQVKIEHPTFINYVCMQLEIWEILTRIEGLQFNLILEHHYSREKVLQSMCCSPLV